LCGLVEEMEILDTMNGMMEILKTLLMIIRAMSLEEVMDYFLNTVVTQ
jgi:hypothetical protein